jgi:DNA-binding transcriptional regulator YiaG
MGAIRLYQATPARHLLKSEIRPTMAKADLRKAETAMWREAIGKAIERTRTLSGLQLQEFASAVARDERQVARWISGVERPQLDAILAAPGLGKHFIQALAELSGDVVIETVVRMRREVR